jgi:hypothetical protein
VEHWVADQFIHFSAFALAPHLSPAVLGTFACLRKAPRGSPYTTSRSVGGGVGGVMTIMKMYDEVGGGGGFEIS